MEVDTLNQAFFTLNLLAFAFIIFEPDLSPTTTLVCGALATFVAAGAEDVRKVGFAKSPWYILVFAILVLRMASHNRSHLETGAVTLLGALTMLLLEENTERFDIASALVRSLGVYVTSPFLNVLLLWSSLLSSSFLSALTIAMILSSVIGKLLELGAAKTLYLARALGVGIGDSPAPVGSMCNIVANNVLENYKGGGLNLRGPQNFPSNLFR